MDPLSIARYGMRAAEMRLNDSAIRVAQNGASLDSAGELVEQVEAKQAFAANVGVARIADEMWRSLMDIQTR
jgi:flagellar basal body rod protein FlgC